MWEAWDLAVDICLSQVGCKLTIIIFILWLSSSRIFWGRKGLMFQAASLKNN
jgi:hypothetical protein